MRRSNPLRLIPPRVGFLVIFASLACGSSGGEAPAPAATGSAAGASAFPLSVTDSSGKTLTLDQAPRRIISDSPGATETLFAVGAGPAVVAVDRFADYPAETAALPRLEYSRPTAEPALALSPDLVIMATRQEAQVEAFRAVGLSVLYLKEPADIRGVIESVRLIGKVTGHLEAAEALAGDMERRIAAVEAKMRGVTRGPVVYYELTPDLYSAAPESFIGGLLSLVGAKNVAAGTNTPFPQLSQETVLKADPEVVLLADAGASGGQSLATLKERPGWSAMRAVQSGRVHEIDANVYSRPGPRIVEALEALVKLFYPNLT
jgi:iron complex transport system substrate-binding protein